MRNLTPRELKALIDAKDGGPFLLDVREHWEFEHCHIDGSVLIPMGQIQYHLDELADDRPIAVICHHGIRSRHIAIYLQSQGFGDVINLAGGVARWADDIDPSMPRY